MFYTLCLLFFQDYDFSQFKALDTSLIDTVDAMLTERIPTLMSMLPTEDLELSTEDISGGVFDLMSNSPFSSGASEGLL